MQAFSMTDIGRHRKMNQDYVYISKRPVGNLPNLFIVADGMGGHNAGEYASRHTVNTIVSSASSSDFIQPAAILEEAIKAANKELIRQASLDTSMWGMGTTVVAAVILENRLYVANVGDSRLYIVNKSITQITKDHSYVEEMVRRGEIAREDAREHPDKNIITRAIGARDYIEADFFDLELQTGDIVLLCSDGLTNMVDDETIRQILTSDKSLEDRVEELVRTANQNGGKDNISAIVIEPLADEVEHD